MRFSKPSLLQLLPLLLWLAAPGSSSAQWPDRDESLESARARLQARVPLEFPPLEGPVDPGQYRLGPGDELELALFGRVSTRVPLSVNAEGSIYVPNLGHVRVGGLSLIEARARLESEFEKRYRGVQADITLLKPRRILVHVAGEVVRPGLVELQGPARVSEAVKSAGGFRGGASRRNLTVERAGTVTARADLERYTALGLVSENPYLDNGDIVRVPASLRHVEVRGEVARPGIVEFRPGDRLSDLVALAGGARSGADTESVEVWRFHSSTEARSQTVSLRAALDSPGAPSDPLLEPDDRVFVRNVANWHRTAAVAVAGEALRPGTYAIPTQGQRASELIARFGGFTRYADVNSATVFRPGLMPLRDSAYVSALRVHGEGDREDAEFLKVRALAHGTLSLRFRRLVAGDTAADFLLLDGDVLTVPTRTGSVAVYGAVRQPGAVAFRSGADLEDYVRAAGGYGRRADRGRVRVTHAAAGQPVPAKDAGAIEEGDLVWVPERGRRSFIKSVGSVVAFVAQLATVYLVIDQATQ